jgi:hypothetical protein
MPFFEKDDILAKTNGGLDVIIRLFPDAQECVGRTNKKFKIRDNEKTPSATLKQLQDGNWVVTDFGGDSKPRNAVELVREKYACDFAKALEYIADWFNIPSRDGISARSVEPVITSRPAEEDEAPGSRKFSHKEGFTDYELEVMFAEHVRKSYERERLVETLKKYGCTALEFYTGTKNGKTYTIASTDEFPIFHFARGKFSKIYQPLSKDKSRRFIYEGEFDKRYINGLKQCQAAFDDLQNAYAEEKAKKDEEDQEDKPKKKKLPKLPEIVICSGERDALNMAALGYLVVWFNSETYHLDGNQYRTLASLADELYYLGDIDATGRKEAHRIAFQYLDLKVIKLPKELTAKRDQRGNPCKDLRDYLQHYPNANKNIRELMKAALPYRFWDEVPEYDRNGDFKRMKYDVNNVHLLNFLGGCGFGRLRMLKTEEDLYVQVTGNIVKRVRTRDIRDFVNRFLETRNMDIPLRNTFLRSAQLNDSSLMNLPTVELDFTAYDQKSQYLFFRNCSWKISADGIDEIKPGGFDRYIWEEKVINHTVEKTDKQFEVKFDERTGHYDIVLPPFEQQSLLFRYIHNTCRMHWKVEEYGVEERLADGNVRMRNELTAQEQQEEKLHLINRLYALGYMMHRYKDSSRPWAVWALESKLTDEDESKGGSGKSIYITIPKHFINAVSIPGRDPRVTENKHILEKVNEHVDYVYVDDADRYLNFSFFYPMITGAWDINPKNMASFTLEYEEAPKLAFSSNFPPRNADQSTSRRLLYTVFSDYYHHGPNDEFPDERTPHTDFGKNLFSDFTEKEWNDAINLVAQCIQFYLRWPEKVNPPMDNVTKRNLKNEMGDAFQAWADVYFSINSGNRDKLIPRHEVQEHCKGDVNMRHLTSQSFLKKLQSWVKFNGFSLNPREFFTGDERRIIRKLEGKSTEMIYIRTKEELNPDDLRTESHDSHDDSKF